MGGGGDGDKFARSWPRRAVPEDCFGGGHSRPTPRIHPTDARLFPPKHTHSAQLATVWPRKSRKLNKEGWEREKFTKKSIQTDNTAFSLAAFGEGRARNAEMRDPQLGFPQNQPNKCCLIVSIAAQLSPSLLNCFPRAIHLHMKYIVARTKA